MKRTAEIILSVIGILFYGLMTAIGALLIWLDNNRDEVENAIRNANEQGSPANQLSMGDLNSVLDVVGTGGVFLTIVSVLAIIIGIISIVFVKGNKKPKPAGIMLIVTAVIVTVITTGGGIFGGIFYLIAGIMCLARKPQIIINE